MKYNKGFGVIVVILIIVGVLLVGGGVYWYITNSQTSGPKNIDTCQTRNSDGTICLDNILDLPQDIGGYSLKDYDNSNWEEKCNTVNNNEQCVKSNEIIYLNKKSNLEIHLYPTFVSKGDYLEIKKTIINMTKEIKDGIYKIENHEILWFTESEFNYIISQYYSIENKTDGTTKYTQKNIDLENEVIKYFMSQYPIKNN